MTIVDVASCDRARALVSRGLDTDLSELERRMIELHASRCTACRDFESESHWITEELRAAPLEPLSRPVAIMVPARRRLPARTVANVASAAALVAVALGGVGFATQHHEQSAADRTLASTFDPQFGDSVLREIRREGLRTGEIQVLPGEPHSATKPALRAIDA